MIHQRIDIYDIQALVDNELGHEDEKRVLSHIEKDAAARKYYEMILHQKNILRRWWSREDAGH